jgi:hypothetical protein
MENAGGCRGFALYSCDSPTDAAGQAAGGRVPRYKIRGPLGWVDYEFKKGIELDISDYVLGTDRTAHVEHYFRYINDNLRKKLEAQRITITGYYSTSKAGEDCWVEFNLNEITEYKKA